MTYLLWPFALLFFLASQCRRLCYSIGLLNTNKVDEPVLCVGNITTGGTGKTPWVHLISQHLKKRGENLCIISRGYSGDFDGVLEVTDDMDPRKCGDEPLWLKKTTGSLVYVGRSRFNAVQQAKKDHKPSCFLLDDGFQHFAMDRDMDLVLLDASAKNWHHHILPVGRLREPFSALKRAHAVIVNKCNFATKERIESLSTQISKHVEADRIFYADFLFDHWQPLISSLDRPLDLKKVSMTCGLGNPRSFLKTLDGLKIDPIKKFIFPDHYYWKPEDIERMTYNMKQMDSRDLVLTEKDAVKLNRYRRHFAEMNMQMWVCKMKVELRGGFENLFKLIDERIRS